MCIRDRRRTARRLRKFSREPKRTATRLNWRRSLTSTVVAVTGLFVACQLPQLGLRVGKVLGQLLPDVQLDDELLLQADNVVGGLLVVNATANFFVYCVVGTSFRRGLLQLLCRRRRLATNPPLRVEKKCELVELYS